MAFSAAPALAGTVTTYQPGFSFNGADTPGGGFNGDNLAIDQSNGNVYLLDPSQATADGQGVVDVFDSSGNYLFRLDGSSTPEGTWKSPFEGPWLREGGAGIAVDNSTGPTQGQLYVVVWAKITNGKVNDSYVDVFSPSGEFLYQINSDSIPQSALQPDVKEPAGLAVDPTGNVYVIDRTSQISPETFVLDKFTAAGNFIAQTQVMPGDRWYRHSLAVDPSGRFYTAGQGLDVFSPDETLLTPISSQGQGVALIPSSGEILSAEAGFDAKYDSEGNLLAKFGSGGRAIAYAPSSERVYVSQGGSVAVFEPTTVTAPDVSLQAASEVTPFALTLNGTINPQGFDTPWHFEYREAGTIDWTSTPEQTIPAGSADVPVSAEIAGLQQHTTYNVRLVAENSKDHVFASASGNVLTAAIPPDAETAFVGPRTPTGARINAWVNPQHAPTTFFFEYGIDTSYGSSAPISEDADAGEGLGVKLVSTELTGLSPETTYHYRVIAENEAGEVTGADRTFTTRSASELVLPQRGIELVSDPDTGNQNVERVHVSDDGSRAIWSGTAGTPGGTTGSLNSFLATRTTTGWHSKNLIPPAPAQVGNGDMFYTLVFPTSDLSKGLYSVVETVAGESALTYVRLDLQQHQDVLAVNTAIVPHTLDATSNFSHVVARDEKKEQVYELDGETPRLLSLMPSGSPPVCGIERDIGFRPDFYSETHWIAVDDASRVFFRTRGDDCDNPYALYVRNRETETTEEVSANGMLAWLSPDGREAVFSTALSQSPQDTNGDGDIYLWREGVPSECLTCVVPDAAVDSTDVLTELPIQVSDDLSRIYFTSPRVLAAGASETTTNLYVLHHGTIDLIGSPAGSIMDGASQMSADGRVLLFTGGGNLTSDDITANEQIYRYDDGDGSLECISCKRDGVTDHGAIASGPARLGFAATSSATMSADGNTVAFTTATSLVREDVNGRSDVYEWHNGKVGLITDGVIKWPEDPRLRGISSDGRDVFFTFAARLTGFEQSLNANLYDARIGGGFVPPTPPAHCVEDSCQGPLQAAPAPANPGSASTAGPGNSSPRFRKHRKRHHRAKRHKAHHHKRQTRQHAKQQTSRPTDRRQG